MQLFGSVVFGDHVYSIDKKLVKENQILSQQRLICLKVKPDNFNSNYYGNKLSPLQVVFRNSNMYSILKEFRVINNYIN